MIHRISHTASHGRPRPQGSPTGVALAAQWQGAAVPRGSDILRAFSTCKSLSCCLCHEGAAGAAGPALRRPAIQP
eukprot:762546-Hanusia_phi.AAC.2